MAERSYFDLFTGRDDDAVSVSDGDTIFETGDPADCFYVVRRGAVELRNGDTVLEVVGPSGIFGEMALVDGGPRSASAIAAGDSELVRVDQPRFEYLVQQTPYFAQEVMRVMAKRLRATTERL